MENNINLNMSMGFLEIIGMSFNIFKKNFSFYLKVMVVYIIPSAILTVFALFEAIKFYNIINLNPNDQKAFVHFLSLVTMTAFILLVNTLYKSCIIEGTKDIILEKTISLEKIINNSIKSFFGLFLNYIAGSILITMGLCTFVIPGLIMMVLLLYIPQVFFLENKSILLNLKKSIIFSFKSIVTTFLIPSFLYMTYLGVVIIFMSLFTSDFIMQIFTGGIKPDIKINYDSMNPGYKIFLIIQLFIFYLFYYLFYLFIQIAVTLKYMNIKTLIEGPIKDKSVISQEASV